MVRALQTILLHNRKLIKYNTLQIYLFKTGFSLHGTVACFPFKPPDSFNPQALKQVIVVLLGLTHWMGGASYIRTNGTAQRGAKSKHRPHSVVNQFKCFLYNHTATTRLRAGRLYCCKKKAGELVNLFLLPFLSTSPLWFSLFNHVYYLPSFHPLLCSPPSHCIMQSISHNRLEGIIRGARRETVCPLQCFSTVTHTHINTHRTSATLTNCRLELLALTFLWI